MLKVQKERWFTLPSISALKESVERWWLMMTDEEQKQIFVRAGTVAACAVATTITLPMLGQTHSVQVEAANYRAQITQLAEADDAGAVVRAAPNTPALLSHPWLQTVEYSLERDTNSALSIYAARDRDGAALKELVSFKAEHIDRADAIKAEHMCLAQAVFYESANESLEGQMAVAEVVMNRVADHRYPNTACDVVFQGATRTTGCQFSFTCDGSMDKRKPSGWRWENAQNVAAHVLMDQHERRTEGATHYHATYVDPVWNAGLVKTEKIGLHVFYRFPRGAEWARASRDVRAKQARIRKAKAEVQADNAALEAELFETISADADDLNARALSALTNASVATRETRTIQTVAYTPAP